MNLRKMLYISSPKQSHLIKFTVHNGTIINNTIYTLNTITKLVTWINNDGVYNEDKRYTQRDIDSYFYTKTWIKVEY